jgi:hypothetical protein
MAYEEEKQAVERLLASAGHRVTDGAFPPPSRFVSRVLNCPELRSHVTTTYSALGGCGDCASSDPRGWDIETPDFVVEFDEQQHFNRYRDVTLSSGIYAELPAFPLREYRGYCVTRERECIRKACGGKYWTSSGAESHFGPADPPRTFASRGAPRWKQRALYDMIRDVIPFIAGIAVVRIAVWDALDVHGRKMTVREALATSDPAAGRKIVELIGSRACCPFPRRA